MIEQTLATAKTNAGMNSIKHKSTIKNRDTSLINDIALINEVEESSFETDSE